MRPDSPRAAATQRENVEKENDSAPRGATRLGSWCPSPDSKVSQPDSPGIGSAVLTQVVLVGPLSEPGFAIQLNGALRRLARSGYEVSDIKLISDGSHHSALILYRVSQAEAEAAFGSEERHER
jgi:hypothetical protein